MTRQAFLWVVCCAIGGAAPAAEPVELRVRVAAIFDDVQAAVARGDIERAVSHFDPEVLVFHPGQHVVRGRDVLRRELRTALATHAIAMEEEVIDVQPIGEQVLAIGHYWHRLTPRAGGAATLVTGRFLVVFRPDSSGRLRIWRDMDHAAPPDVATRTPASVAIGRSAVSP
jgi:ketosteroid isomerase-like protein